VAASSTEAEYIATAFAAEEAIWLRQLLRETEQFVDPKEQSELPSTVLYGDDFPHQKQKKTCKPAAEINHNPETRRRTIYLFI